ncbi:Replication factor A protein 1 [Entamoeba marina]
MSVTYDAIKKLVENNKVTSPLIVQVQSVVPIDDKRRRFATQMKSSLEVEAKISDCYYSISTIITCDTIEEADTIEESSLIEVIDGSMLDGNDSSDDLLFAIKKFKIVSDQVNNQLCPNIKELKRKSQLPSSQINLNEIKTTPFVKLTQNNLEFVVKGVVVSKKAKIKWNGGYLFNFIIQDEDGKEMKCTCLPDNCDKCYDFIVENGTYHIFMGYLQPQKNNPFKTKRMIDLDCIITLYSIIQPSGVSIQIQNNILIEDIENRPINSSCSICCVINKKGKTQPKKDKRKRVIEITDESNCLIEIIFWDDLTQIPNEFKVGDIVQFNDITINEFGHKQLTYTRPSSFKLSTGSNETQLLSQKIVENNVSPNTQRYSDSISSSIPTMSLKEFEENARNANGKPFKANVTGFIIAFRTDTISYFGCGNCKKKVNHNATVCPHCNKKCNPQHRYNLKIEIQDSTNKIWATMFDEVATKYMGKSEKELIALKESNFDDYLNSFRDKTYTKMTLGLEGKFDDQKNVLRISIFHCQILD